MYCKQNIKNWQSSNNSGDGQVNTLIGNIQQAQATIALFIFVLLLNVLQSKYIVI